VDSVQRLADRTRLRQGYAEAGPSSPFDLAQDFGLRLRLGRQDRYATRGLAGVVTESILVYAYTNILHYESGSFFRRNNQSSLKLRRGRQDMFFFNNTDVNNVLRFGLVL